MVNKERTRGLLTDADPNYVHNAAQGFHHLDQANEDAEMYSRLIQAKHQMIKFSTKIDSFDLKPSQKKLQEQYIGTSLQEQKHAQDNKQENTMRAIFISRELLPSRLQYLLTFLQYYRHHLCPCQHGAHANTVVN